MNKEPEYLPGDWVELTKEIDSIIGRVGATFYVKQVRYKGPDVRESGVLLDVFGYIPFSKVKRIPVPKRDDIIDVGKLQAIWNQGIRYESYDIWLKCELCNEVDRRYPYVYERDYETGALFSVPKEKAMDKPKPEQIKEEEEMNAFVECRCEEVIITTLTKRGNGVGGSDPVRRITQVWTKEGVLIAEHDPCAIGTITMTDESSGLFTVVPPEKEHNSM